MNHLNHHGLKQNDNYKCTFESCNKIYKFKPYFLKHVKSHYYSNASIINSPVLSSVESHALWSVESHALSSDTDSPLVPLSSEQNSSDLSSDINSPDVLLPESNNQLNFGINTALKLHSRNNFSRKDVNSLVSIIQSGVIDPIVRDFQNYIDVNFGAISTSSQRASLSTLIAKYENAFVRCRSDYQLFKYLHKYNLTSDAYEFTINKEIAPIFRNGELRIDEEKCTGVLLPIAFQFRRFFEQHDRLSCAINELNKFKKNQIDCIPRHIITSESWQRKIKSFPSDAIVMPFFMYADDAEINNPLGGHKEPITFVYYSFPLIRDCEIFLGSIFKAKYYKAYGNDNCLTHLVCELKSLEENGIQIQTTEGIKTVHFVLAMILGDNLGLNTILGFSGSFQANFFCRFCKEHRDESHTSCFENTNLLRNIQN